jgi:hypothetical protein
MCGITTYVSHPHIYPFHRETFHLLASTTHIAMVDISRNSSNHRGYLLQTFYDGYITHITGMPNLIAISKMLCVAVIPT